MGITRPGIANESRRCPFTALQRYCHLKCRAVVRLRDLYIACAFALRANHLSHYLGQFDNCTPVEGLRCL
jgi:hypothetical protein